MRFLLYSSIGPDVADVLRELGHAPTLMSDTPVKDAEPLAVFTYAREQQLEVITADRDVVEVPAIGRRDLFARVLVFLQEPSEQHGEAVRRLFSRYKRLTPGRLYTVTGGRVKVRQLPTT